MQNIIYKFIRYDSTCLCDEYSFFAATSSFCKGPLIRLDSTLVQFFQVFFCTLDGALVPTAILYFITTAIITITTWLRITWTTV